MSESKNVFPLRADPATKVQDRLAEISASVPEHGFNGAVVMVYNRETGVWGFSWIGEINGVQALGLLELAKSEILKSEGWEY